MHKMHELLLCIIMLNANHVNLSESLKRGKTVGLKNIFQIERTKSLTLEGKTAQFRKAVLAKTK